jgi:GTP-binding protein
MIIGENARADDLDVNPTKAKQQTNMRASSADVLVRLAPPTRLTLEASLEFLRDDECVEVTPDSVRLRKLVLEKVARLKTSKRRDSAPK